MKEETVKELLTIVKKTIQQIDTQHVENTEDEELLSLLEDIQYILETDYEHFI